MDHSIDMAEPHPKKPNMEIPEGLHNFNQPSSSSQTYLNLSVNNLKSFLMEDTLDVDHNSADNLSVIRFNERETFVINAPTSIISHGPWTLYLVLKSSLLIIPNSRFFANGLALFSLPCDKYRTVP